MRILHFYKTARPDSMGGIEQVIHLIATGTARLGAEVDVLALTRGPAPQEPQQYGLYRNHRVKQNFELASTGFSLLAFGAFSRLARQADLIHYHFPWPFMDVVHFATRPRKPAIVTYHSDIVQQKHLMRFYAPLQRRFLANVERIAATSPNYVATSPVLARFSSKVIAIPIGIDRDAYPPAAPDRLAYWRSRFGPRFFLFVGVLRYYKGLHILIEACRDTSFPVVIAGAGPIEARLKEQAARLGARNVHFAGHVSETDKVALLTLCEAVLFPSHLRSEAFGVSLLEGAMLGKPMISSEIGTGTTFINVAGETGLVIPPGDANALRHAMRSLWEDPRAATAMGERAARRHQQIFTSERMARAYFDLYQELCRDARQGHNLA
ncbi:MAG: glycosyltransferase family 4 protein [Chromatiales bacterium]|nr:glycosyltransferase family 4 protein [Chromatiales bacterium]